MRSGTRLSTGAASSREDVSLPHRLPVVETPGFKTTPPMLPSHRQDSPNLNFIGKMKTPPVSSGCWSSKDTV